VRGPSIRPQQAAIALLGVSLSVLAAVKVWLALVGLSAPFEHDYGEAIIYNQAALLLRGEPLYHSLGVPPFTVAAYTPIYYVLAAVLKAALGPGFIWGRALSLGSGLVAAFCVARLTIRSAGSVAAGWLAAVMFIAVGFVIGMPWFGLYRVDTLGVALSLAAVLVLAEKSSNPHIIAAGLLAGLAVLTKQTFLAATLAGSLWLLSCDRRKAVVFATTAVLLVGLTCGALQLTTGGFLEDTVAANLNPFQLDLFANLGAIFLSTQFMPLLLAGLYLAQVRPWRVARTRLLVVYWAASALQLIGLGKVGANTNYWIEFAASTSILAALGLWTILPGSGAAQPVSRTTSRLVVCLCGVYASLIVTSGAIPQTWESGAYISAWRLENDAGFSRLVARVRSEPREVLAEPMDILVLADKPILLEPLIFSLLVAANKWDPRPVVDRICAGDVGLLILITRLEELPQNQVRGYPMWPPPVTAALMDRMQFDAEQAGRFIYVSRSLESLTPESRAPESPTPSLAACALALGS
jgi:hypothetical protein